MEHKQLLAFCKLFNEVNETKITPNNVKNDTNLKSLFLKMCNEVKTKKDLMVAQGYVIASSTKSQSYLNFDAQNKDYKVWQFLIETKNKTDELLTRSELADRMGIRLQTICGCVTRLKKTGHVKVAGTIVDENSKAEVELLEGCGND